MYSHKLFDIITQIYLPYLRHFATLVAATFSDFEQSGQYILTVIQSSMYRTRYKYFFHELPRTHTHDTCTNFCMEAWSLEGIIVYMIITAVKSGFNEMRKYVVKLISTELNTQHMLYF